MGATRILDLVKEIDGFPCSLREPERFKTALKSLYTLVWKDDEGEVPLGYVPDFVVEELSRTPTSLTGAVEIDRAARTVLAFHGPPTEADRSALIAGLLGNWREAGAFKVLKGWRDEPWPVYGRKGELLYNVERSAVGLIGVNRYGVHMTAYVRDESVPYGMRLWVPKRSASKSTFPGMLDNTVAGGLMTGEDPFECVIREADEEASLPEAVVRSAAKLEGVITFIYITEERAGGETGLIYPECQWVYDLELTMDVVPEPKDGEAESFSLCTVDEVRAQLAQGLFKPGCALVVLDFFIRHGILTPDNEPDFDEINRRIHRKLPFPGPHGHDISHILA